MFLPVGCPKYPIKTEEKTVTKGITQEMRPSVLFVSGRDFEEEKRAVVANLFSLWGVPLDKQFECVTRNNTHYRVVVTGPSNFVVPADAPLYIRASRIVSAARQVSEKITIIAHVTPRRGVRERIKEYMLQAENPFQYVSLGTILRNDIPFPDSVRIRIGEELAKFEYQARQFSTPQGQEPASLHTLLSIVNTIVTDAVTSPFFSKESICVADNDIIRFLCIDTHFIDTIGEHGSCAFMPIRLRQSKSLFYKIAPTYPGFKTDLSFLVQ